MDSCFQPASTLAREIRSGRRSPVDLVDAYLARIHDRNEDLNAYITVCEESARGAAERAERAVDEGDELASLHGIPVALKDLTAFKRGVKHTFGCRLFSDNVAAHTAVFVQRLEDAGAIVLGKTNLPEFGHRPTTDNRLVGATATPFDLEMNAGGSSGGSAVAVADGLTALGQGGDAGGSVRIPAALCGVYGFKPTYGRIPQPTRPNTFRTHSPFIDKGPITRTVTDAAMMLDVMVGPHPRDPFSLPDTGCDFVGATDRGIQGRAIAFCPRLGGFAVSDDVLEVVREALDDFVAAGATVDCIDLDYGVPYETIRNEARKPIFGALRAMVYQNLIDSHGIDVRGPEQDKVPQSFVNGIEEGIGLTMRDLERMNRARTKILETFVEIFGEYDLLVSPTIGVASVPHGVIGPRTVNGTEIDPWSDWLLTWPFNLTGHPAASLPAGRTSEGYPVGLQLIASRFDDELVIAGSAAFERQRPWRSYNSGAI